MERTVVKMDDNRACRVRIMNSKGELISISLSELYEKNKSEHLGIKGGKEVIDKLAREIEQAFRKTVYR